MPKTSDTARLDDYKFYQNASHLDLIKITRAYIAMPFGDLTKLHKDKAKELGATSPSAVFLRAIIFTRLVNDQTRRRPRLGGPTANVQTD